MPNLDVSEVTTDPDFATTVWVKRTKSTVGLNGRLSASPSIIKNVVGVITSAGPNDLRRMGDEQHTGRVMCFITKFPLHATAPGFLPDEILWAGDTYVVLQLDPYPEFGEGFFQALIGSVDSQDRAAPIVGQEDFSDPSNSGLT